MVRGTTPRIFVSLNLVDPNDIVSAYLTISQKSHVLEKDIDTMIIGEKYIAWDLSQEETLSFAKGSCKIECRYKSASGKTYVSKEREEGVRDVQKGGVI